MSGGGKAGNTQSQTAIPQWLEDAARKNVGRAEGVQQLGYIPYYGADVAAFNPTQEAAMKSNMSAAEAFGLVPQGTDAMAGVPTPESYANGTKGYSAQPLYEQALGEMAIKDPQKYLQYQALYNNTPYNNNPFTKQTGQQDLNRGDGTSRPGVDDLTGQPIRTYGSVQQALDANDKHAAYRLAHKDWREGEGMYTSNPIGDEGEYVAPLPQYSGSLTDLGFPGGSYADSSGNVHTISSDKENVDTLVDLVKPGGLFNFAKKASGINFSGGTGYKSPSKSTSAKKSAPSKSSSYDYSGSRRW